MESTHIQMEEAIKVNGQMANKYFGFVNTQPDIVFGKHKIKISIGNHLSITFVVILVNKIPLYLLGVIAVFQQIAAFGFVVALYFAAFGSVVALSFF